MIFNHRIIYGISSLRAEFISSKLLTRCYHICLADISLCEIKTWQREKSYPKLVGAFELSSQLCTVLTSTCKNLCQSFEMLLLNTPFLEYGVDKIIVI